ncbi:MAG: hypothetical protein H7174_06125 [Flavobacterium sp.]|nr:hypothetical protein [Flavobacterium sp.]
MKRFFLIIFFVGSFCNAQTFNLAALEHLDEFFKDAVYYSDKYVTPATDAAVYQASSAWIYTAKKNKLWSTSLGIHSNIFFVPKPDRDFKISDTDFTFLKIQGATSATIPTALGDGNQISIIDIYSPNGIIDPAKPIKTPQGVNQEEIFYPHLSGSVCVGFGTELLGKFAPKVKIKSGEYQVYGFGIKHNLDQYIEILKKNKINLSASVLQSNEIISFDFLNIQPTPFGTLGIDKITGIVKSLQFQINASKQFGNLEIMIGSLTNKSDFEYLLTGELGTIEKILPVQQILNDKLRQIYKSKINSIIEVSATYNYRKIYFQSAVAFNKFINTNISIHYKFN